MCACVKNYVDETKKRNADVFTEHLRSIKNNCPGLPIAEHFNSSEHFILNARVTAMTICANDTYRKTEEERLIYKLGTPEPWGMNVRFHSFPVSIEAP